MKTDVTIRKALMADLDSVMNIYAEARQYMKEQGNPEQWGEDYPQRSLVEADIAAGKCYVCGSDGSIGAAFYFAVENDDGIAVTGGGYGHGVGMSQNGSGAMAEMGYGYEEILAFYYPETVLLQAY